MKAFICLLMSCLSLLIPSGACAADHSLQRTYSNENFHFCIDFPSAWSYGESYTRNGAILTPRDTKPFVLLPRISVGGHVDQPSQHEDRPQTLEENIQSVVESLRESGSAKDIRIEKSEELPLQRLPARDITLRYRDSTSGEEWMVKDVNLIDQDHIVYFLELKCHPKDAIALSAIFDAMVHSLRIQCRGKAR